MGALDWVNFKGGRARFSAGIRGWDELGHETFCVEVDGQELFGEIHDVYPENPNDYNLEIISFGYRDRGDVGLPGADARVVFTREQKQRIIELIRNLVEIISKQEDKPFVLYQGIKGKFLGGVHFEPGWIRIVDPGLSQP